MPVVFGRVHCNEHRQWEVIIVIVRNDGALTRKQLVVCIDGHEFLVAGHAPERTHSRVICRVMHGCHAPQVLELRYRAILVKQVVTQ